MAPDIIECWKASAIA